MTRAVLALARFEARLARRRLETWLLATIALAPAAFLAVGFTITHAQWATSGFMSHVTADLGVVISAWSLGVTSGLAGAFQVFGWRHREVVHHFADTLDASPVSAVERAWGKFLGATPPFLACFALLAATQAGLALGLGMRPPWTAILVADIAIGLPIAVFATALAFGVHGLTGSRALAWLLPVAFLLIQAPVLDLPETAALALCGLTELPVESDLVGLALPATFWPQRVALIAGACAFVTLAACGRFRLPRHAAERRATVGLMACALGVAVLAVSLVVRTDRAAVAAARATLDAEREVAALPQVEVVRRDVEVEIVPSRGRLEGRAHLLLRNYGDAPIETAHLRLNTELEVTAIESDRGQLPWTRSETMLAVGLPEALAPGASLEVSVAYAGAIDLACLDPELRLALRGQTPVVRMNTRLLGTRPAFLGSELVALGRDAAWYPEPGARAGHEYPSAPSESLAPGTLVVRLPHGWIAASQGRREALPDGATRFVTDVPVPGFSLHAGPLVERATQVRGVTVRLLHHPAHARRVDYLADALPRIIEDAEKRYESVDAESGLAYPHPELTFVEVPQQLAPHVGGWERRNRLAEAGVVLLREGGLFRAALEAAVRREAGHFTERAARGIDVSRSAKDDGSFDGGASKAMHARYLVSSDPFDGTVEWHVLRSAWDMRLRPAGRGRLVIGPGLATFLARTAVGNGAGEAPEAVALLQPWPGSFPAGPGYGSPITRAHEFLRDRDEALGVLETTALDELSACEIAELYPSARELMGVRPFYTVRGLMGRTAWRDAVRELVASPGGRLTWDDLRRVLGSHAPEDARAAVLSMLDAWLDGGTRAAFVVESVEARPVQEPVGSWLVTALVENRGEAAGAGGLSVTGEFESSRLWPFVIAAGERAEVAVVVAGAPQQWRLEAPLARNRVHPSGSVVQRPQESVPTAASHVRVVPPAPGGRPVVVDNADAGFTVALRDGREAHDAPARYAGCGRTAGAEAPLPRYFGGKLPAEWSRWRPDAFLMTPHGAGDATAVVKRGGEGARPARWRAELPAGEWLVEAYLPRPVLPGQLRAWVKLAERSVFRVVHAGGEEVVTVDHAQAVAGWNALGRFRFEGQAEVRLDDVGPGLVVADAVRFTPGR